MEYIVIGVHIVHISLLSCILYTLRKRQPFILGASQDRPKGKTLHTPRGSFFSPEVRKPIYHSEEELWERENDNKRDTD